MFSKEKYNGSISSQHFFVPYCNWSSTQTPMSAPSILKKNTSSHDTKPFGIASSKRIFPQVSWLEERLDKLPGRPFPAKCIPTSPEKAVKSCQTYFYPSPQYIVEQEERISVTELLSKIDSVSRALENEKNEDDSSLRSFDLPSAASRPYGVLGFKITYKDKVYQDWRGVIAPNPVKEHKQVRNIKMKAKKVCKIVKYCDKHLDLQTQKKVKKNGTHLEVFEAFHDSRTHPSSREVLKAVVCIQRYVRGWLERRAFKRIKIKATSHGLSLPAVVRYYRKMMARIKCRAGALDASTPLRYFELEEWMDKKKFYETMFAKRQFSKEMDRNDLPGFFRDCGYFIPTSGIQRVFQMVCPASAASVRSIKKHQAIEMAFTLFPPLGANVKNIITVTSPWVHPVMDGKDGSKYSACPKEAFHEWNKPDNGLACEIYRSHCVYMRGDNAGEFVTMGIILMWSPPPPPPLPPPSPPPPSSSSSSLLEVHGLTVYIGRDDFQTTSEELLAISTGCMEILSGQGLKSMYFATTLYVPTNCRRPSQNSTENI
ncbi:IQ domain-containing protein M [Struthio camelus]|uniref:IQ domain-containing protein M n=1 Tax=Struthio camelus TaxID=8801 RepID=UPI003603B1CF